MCNFISWIEKDGKNYWINDSRLSKHRPIINQIGHSAIEDYYKLPAIAIKMKRELPDDILPKEILDEYKQGKMDLMANTASTKLFINGDNYLIYDTNQRMYAYSQKTKNGKRIIFAYLSRGLLNHVYIRYYDKYGKYNRSNGPSDFDCCATDTHCYYEKDGWFVRPSLHRKTTERDLNTIAKIITEINQTFNVEIPTQLKEDV